VHVCYFPEVLMMAVCLVFLNLLVFASGVIISSDQSIKVNKLIKIKELLDFIEIHLDVCGNYNFCYYSSKRDVSLVFEKESFMSRECCPPCSCDLHCEIIGNCCPDYWLNEYLQPGTVFSDFTELRNALDSSELVKLPAHKKGEAWMECVPDRYLTDIRLRGSIMKGYWVIANCVNNINAGIDHSLCEKEYPNMEEMFIPVVSKLTGKAYRNIHCLICNEGPMDFIMFQVQIACASQLQLNTLSNHPFLIMQQVVKGERLDALCNILLRPPIVSTAVADGVPYIHILRRCEVIDVKGENCLDNSTMSTFCRTFYLPVNVPTTDNAFEYKAVQNAACLECDPEMYTQKKCQLNMRPRIEYKLQLHLKPDENAILKTRLILLRMNNMNRYKRHCEQWFIFDKHDVGFFMFLFLKKIQFLISLRHIFSKNIFVRFQRIGYIFSFFDS